MENPDGGHIVLLLKRQGSDCEVIEGVQDVQGQGVQDVQDGQMIQKSLNEFQKILDDEVHGEELSNKPSRKIQSYWKQYSENLGILNQLVECVLLRFSSLEVEITEELTSKHEWDVFRKETTDAVRQFCSKFNFGRCKYNEQTKQDEIIYPEQIKIWDYTCREFGFIYDMIIKNKIGRYDFSYLYKLEMPDSIMITQDTYMFNISSYNLSDYSFGTIGCVLVKADNPEQARVLFEKYVLLIKNYEEFVPNYSMMIYQLNNYHDVTYSTITYHGQSRHYSSFWSFPFMSPFCNSHQMKDYVIYIKNKLVSTLKAVNLYDAYILAKQYLDFYGYWDVNVEEVVQEAVIVSNKTFTS